MKKLDPNNFDKHKAARLEHKSTLHYAISPSTPLFIICFIFIGTTRYTNPLKRKFRAKRMAAEGDILSSRVFTCLMVSIFPTVDGAGAAPVSKRPNVQMPDEYLPPNKILFLQNLPESVSKDQLMALFSQLRVTRYFFLDSLLLGLATVHVFVDSFLSATFYQVSKSVRSASHSNEKRYRFRGVCGRDECNGRQRCAAQL